jgi:hypothetical protein
MTKKETFVRGGVENVSPVSVITFRGLPFFINKNTFRRDLFLLILKYTESIIPIWDSPRPPPLFFPKSSFLRTCVNQMHFVDVKDISHECIVALGIEILHRIKNAKAKAKTKSI